MKPKNHWEKEGTTYKLIVTIVKSDVIKNVPLFSKLTDLVHISRKTVIAAAIAITAIVIIDYLGSRQMFPYDNFLGAIIFGSNIIVVAVGSFIILKYVSAD